MTRKIERSWPISPIPILIIGILVLSLILILLEYRNANERIDSLRSDLILSHALLKANETMKSFLGSEGVYIIDTATHVDLLQVDQGSDYPRRLSGKSLVDSERKALVSELLNPHNYLYAESFDLPQPTLGFRFGKDDAKLDILVSLEASNRALPHIDIFAISYDSSGVQHFRGFRCINSAALHNLLTPFISSE